MLESVDFSLSTIEIVSLSSVFLLPVILVIIARIEYLKNKNAIQFFLASATSIFLYIIGAVLQIQNGLVVNELISSFMVLVTALLLYLEIWALLSRGYTLGILLTLSNSKKPLNDQQLADSYRAGEGLEWLVNHRLSGLFVAKLISKNNNEVSLTVRGNFIANIYKIFIYIFCLKRTG